MFADTYIRCRTLWYACLVHVVLISSVAMQKEDMPKKLMEQF